MLQKISPVLVILSIASVAIFGFESTYEQRISDSARLLIGLSSIDSNACQACRLGGEMYNNGCKHCAQDSMSFHTHSSDGQPYEISGVKITDCIKEITHVLVINPSQIQKQKMVIPIGLK